MEKFRDGQQKCNMEELLSEEQLTEITGFKLEVIGGIYIDSWDAIKMVNKQGLVTVLPWIREYKGVWGKPGRWLVQRRQKKMFLLMVCSSVKLLATGCCACFIGFKTNKQKSKPALGRLKRKEKKKKRKKKKSPEDFCHYLWLRKPM